MSSIIPHFNATGTNYQVGFKIGEEFKLRISNYLEKYVDFRGVILPFIQSEKGKSIMKGLESKIMETVPWYYDEMKGLSDGSGINFDYILALNTRVEILIFSSYVNKSSQIRDFPLECSDFFLNNINDQAIIHNEDSDKSVYETGYFISCEILSQDYNGIQSPAEKFTSYCYAGHLPGNAFGFNSNGFTFTVNACFPKNMVLSNLPRQILNRMMISAVSLEHLEHLLINSPVGYGFSLNVGYFGNDLSKIKSNWTEEYYPVSNEAPSLVLVEDVENIPVLWNYEIASNSPSVKFNRVSKHSIVPSKFHSNKFSSFDYYYHFNHFKRIQEPDVEENYIVIGSKERAKRAVMIKKPEFVEDLFRLAYDDQGTETNPIHRKRTLQFQTICTSLFNFKEKTLSIFQDKKTEPVICFKMNI